MTAQTLFAFGPYLAVAISALGFCIRLPRIEHRLAGVHPDWRLLGSGRLVRAALGVVLVAHLLAALAPATILRWSNQPVRLYLLEAGAFAVGGLAAFGLVGGLRRFIAEPSQGRAAAIADSVFASSLILSVIVGLYVAARYRWATSWSLATVVPYARSLARGEPNTLLISATPVLAQLHVVAGFSALAALPFSRVGTALLVLVWRNYRAMAERARATVATQRGGLPWRDWFWPDEDLLEARKARRRQRPRRRRLPAEAMVAPIVAAEIKQRPGTNEQGSVAEEKPCG